MLVPFLFCIVNSYFIRIFYLMIYFISYLLVPATAQTRKPMEDITLAMDSAYSFLKEMNSINKKIPPVYEKQVLYALSYFPELAQTKIRLKIKKSRGGIISTRPTVGSLLRRSSKRSYIVAINDSIEGRKLPSFSNAGVNGQVGILGHEFSHIIYFQNKTGFGLMGILIGHVSRKYMDHFENKTDSVDIERGLGYQLIDWNLYLEKGFRALLPPGAPNPFEKTGTRERYMSIDHIRGVMAKSALYQ